MSEKHPEYQIPNMSDFLWKLYKGQNSDKIKAKVFQTHERFFEELNQI